MATPSDEQARASDLRRLQAVAAGDQATFAGLVDEHGPALLRFTASMLGSTAEAEDVVQETLVKLWQAAATWKPQARLATWLHTVCYNRAIDRLRGRRGFVDVSALDEREDEGPLADAGLIRQETVASVRDALRLLPQRQRTALLLFHFQELPQAECAAVMELSESAFESLLARARRALRGLLETQPGTGSGGRDD